MSFTIRHSREQDLDLVIIKDENNGTEVALLPGFGATLHSFCIHTGDGSFFDVIDSYYDLAEVKAEIAAAQK